MRARMIHVLGLATAAAALVTGLVVPAASAGPVAPAKTTAPVAHATTGCRHHLMAYVTTTSTHTVTPVDTVTGIALKPIPDTGGPQAVVVAPDGRTAYVAHWPSDGWLTVISTRTGTVVKRIPVPGPYSMMTVLGITPNGKMVYVTRGVTLVPIRTADNTALKPINVGTQTETMLFTPDSRKIYLSTWSGTVVPISTATNTMGKPIALPTYSPGIALSPDGRTLYATSGNMLTPIRTATDKLGQPIRFPEQVNRIVLSKNGRTAYVANVGEYGGPGTLYPVRLATRTILAPIKLPGVAGWMVFTPDGKTLYVGEQLAGTVTAIRTATRTVLANIKVGPMSGLTVTPDGRTAYALGGNSLVPIRVATNKAAPAIRLTGTPTAMAFFRS
jgi:YVTN family beta-propeller protein